MAASTTLSGASNLPPVNEIVFSEFQARVFNQTEAAYKLSGYLGTPLFEDSYLLSKATAEYIVQNVPVAGGEGSVNSSAMNVYRAVLGITPPETPPAPPAPTTPTRGPQVSLASDRPAVTPTSITRPTNQQAPVSPVRPAQTTTSAAVRPTAPSTPVVTPTVAPTPTETTSTTMVAPTPTVSPTSTVAPTPTSPAGGSGFLSNLFGR